MRFYRIAILLGIVPLVILTIISVVGLLRERPLGDIGNPNTSADEQTEQVLAASRKAVVDRPIVLQLQKVTWESNPLKLEPLTTTKSDLNSVTTTWNSYLVQRQLA